MNDDFKDFKKYAEYEILPLLISLRQLERDRIRGDLRLSKNEEELFKKILYYNEKLNLNIGFSFNELKQKFLENKLENKDKPIIPMITLTLEEIYNKIIEILKKYCDIKEEYYNIIALWIIGTYYHKSFPTYPYLFFNACKGSGKTRLLKLIAELSYNGKVLNSLTEAVVFRTAADRTFCIDEFESIGSKDKSTLRELLNSAYKKGVVVERSYKTKGKFREKQKIEQFEVYCPIAMANIWGMESVLADRCVSIILERSNKKNITRLLELFDRDQGISEVKLAFVSDTSVPPHIVTLLKSIYDDWNDFVISNNKVSLVSIVSEESKVSLVSLYKKLDDSELEGRNLELFFPLFILAERCGVLEKTIETAKEIVESKKEDDKLENNDIALLKFIAELPFNTEKDGLFAGVDENNWLAVKQITSLFKDSTDWDWLSPDWIGRALKRLNLIINRRRLGKGREVRLNFIKAQEKMKMFEVKND